MNSARVMSHSLRRDTAGAVLAEFGEWTGVGGRVAWNRIVRIDDHQMHDITIEMRTVE
jgi:hypothetical protein